MPEFGLAELSAGLGIVQGMGLIGRRLHAVH